MSVGTMPAPVVPVHFPLAALLWPQRAGGISDVMRRVILVALGTALLTLSAKVNLLPSCRRSGVCSIVAARTPSARPTPLTPLGQWLLAKRCGTTPRKRGGTNQRSLRGE
ncbi:hypothetical protein SAMN05443247_08103 [Bradyrhizobium erythrophlei]|nr:hypothetical protein SAMN05443247_08103 [Bradyrhizobium erythrophlei]